MGSSYVGPECSRRDAALDVVVNWCGWLVAVVFVLGCVRGWWWGGDLHNLDHLPLIGDSVAKAAVKRRGWPVVPLLAMVCGAVLVRRIWFALANVACGEKSRARRRRPGRFPGPRGC
ncbi:hypothetical protein [Streptomyces mirabilis]